MISFNRGIVSISNREKNFWVVELNVGLATWLSTGDMSTTAFPDYQHLTEDVELQKLYSLAMDARTNSYSPYSKFRVGACLLTLDGEFIQGMSMHFMLKWHSMESLELKIDSSCPAFKKAAMWRMLPTV